MVAMKGPGMPAEGVGLMGQVSPPPPSLACPPLACMCACMPGHRYMEQDARTLNPNPPWHTCLVTDTWSRTPPPAPPPPYPPDFDPVSDPNPFPDPSLPPPLRYWGMTSPPPPPA